MNNSRVSLFAVCVLALAFLGFLGCEQIAEQDSFYEMNIPQDKLKQIEPMNLQEFKSEPAKPGEAVTLPAPEEAAKEMSFSLEQTRALALENNLDLQAFLMAPGISEAGLRIEQAKFEAAFFTNFNYGKTDRPAATFLNVAGSQYDNGSVDLGVQMPLQTGGTITLDFADSRSKTNFTSTAFNPTYNETATFSISQPLLRNAGPRVNNHSIRIAQYNKAITDNLTKLEVIRLVAAADRVYWRLYAARRELQVRLQQHDLALKQLERAKRMVNAGETAQVEIVRAEAGVARQLAAIIAAENALRDRQREFKRLLNKPGVPIDSVTIPIPSDEPNPVHYELQAQPMIARAMENRWEMLDLELKLAQDASAIDFAKNQTLPLVTMEYSYNINGVGATRAGAMDLLSDKNFESHSLGARLVVPLGNEAAKNALRQAILLRRQRLVNRESRKQLIQQEVLTVLDNLEALWQQLLAARQSSILEGRLYEAEVRQFEQGLRTSTDVFQAQTTFADAQSLEIAALVNYEISLVDIAYATGTLLGAAKIEWQPVTPDLTQ
ncbi:MAG: TolC family protein [Phycisphaerae bacterium]|nr:TolC family protein [Phycisphaerae bacterium]